MPSQTGSIDLTSQVAANSNAIEVASNDATTKANNAAKTATNYITADSNGIKIHMTDNSTTYQHQSATGTNFYVNSLKRSEVGGEGLKVYVGDTAGSETKVGHFGEYTRIGDIESSHTTISPLPNAGVAMYDETGSTRALRVATSGLYIGSDDTAHFSDNGFTLFPQGSDVGDVVRLNAGSIGTQRTNITRTIKLEANETLSTLSLSGAPTISHIYCNTTELVKGTDYIQQTTTNSGGVDWEYNSTKDGHYINTNIIFNPAITGPASIIIECGVLIPQNYYMRMGPEWYNHTVIDDEGFRVINYNGDPVFNVDMASDGTSSVTVGESDKQHMVLDAAGLSAYDENGDYAEIKGIIDGENIKPNSVTANQINAENLEVSAANITGTLSADQINTNNLTIGINQVTNLSSSMAWQGTCATAAGTAAKAVTCAGFALNSGATITVRFTTANTSAAALTLNVNSTGAKTIYVAGAATAAANQLLWAANATISFTYDGTYWRVTGEPRNWYGACTIAATTAAKTAAINEVVLCKGSTVNLQMTNANAVANPTLNITSLGAKDIYTANAKLTATSSNNWSASSTIPFVFDGQNFRYDSEASSKANSIEIGGRNLVRGTSFTSDTDLTYWLKNQNPILSVESGSLKIVANQTSSTPGVYTDISVEEGKYTVSFWYKAITENGMNLRSVVFGTSSRNAVVSHNCSINISDTEWHYYEHIFEPTATQAGNISTLAIFLYPVGYTATDGIYIRHLKLEKGNKATDWTPAPEDVAADISAVNTALQTYSTNTNTTLQSLQNQVDGQIEAWYKTENPTLSNEPASTWNTDTLKQRHIGDLYYNVESGHSWRWMQSGNTYEWHQIPDSDATEALALAQSAQNIANSKRRIFTTTPTVPYDVGDLWVDGNSVKYCSTAKTDSGTYFANDWTTTATDDTTAINNIQTQIGSSEFLYSQVEWVCSDGREFIALDWYPESIFGFEIDFENYNTPTASGSGTAWTATSETNQASLGSIFGTRRQVYNKSPYADYELMMYGPTSKVGVLRVGRDEYNAKLYTDGRRQQCSLRGTTYTAPDGTTTTVQFRGPGIDGTQYPTYYMHVFCSRTENSAICQFPGSTKLYSLKFYDSQDELAVDLIPTVRLTDGLAGLYDRVSNRFYPSIGLTYGPLVQNFGTMPSLVSRNAKNNPVVYDTKITTSRLWTADAPTIDKLEDGQQITYMLKWNSVSESQAEELAGFSDSGASANVYLSLTLSDGNTTDWIPCYNGISGHTIASGTNEPSNITVPQRLTTHFITGSNITFTYKENIVAGTLVIPRGWFADAAYTSFSNTNARYVLWYNTIVAKSAIRAASYIVGDETGYQEIGENVTFDLTYPILWSTAAIAATKTNYSNLFTTTYDRTLATCYPAATFPTAVGIKNQILYLVGTLNGSTFTCAQTFLTFIEPSTDDGLIYIPIGKLGNNSTGQNYLIVSTQPNPNMFMYLDGSFQQVSSSTTIATQKLYYRTTSLTAPTAPTTWITTNNPATYNAWNLAVPPLAASKEANATKYPYLYSVEQHKRVDGTVITGEVSNDSNTTIIDGGSIITNSVTATQIAAGAITTDKLDANAVTAGKIAANAITANELAANAVTADKISANAVTTDKLYANAVTAGKIATNAVTADKINAGAVITEKLAANAVTANELAANAVTAAKINASAVTAEKIASNAVTADKINANAVTANKIDTSAVTADKIAANAVTTDKLYAGAVTAGKIATGAITADKIDTNNINASNSLTIGALSSQTQSTILNSELSTDIASAAQTATNYITADSNGIKIHMTGNSNTYQHQTASGTKFYVNNLKRSEVGANGLKVYIGDTAGSETEVGYFGTYARIGNINSSHTTISSDSGIGMYSGSTRMLRIKNSDAYFGSEESVKVGSDGLTLYPSGIGFGPVSKLTCGSAPSSSTIVVKTITVESGDTINSIFVKMGTNISYVKVDDTTLTQHTDYELMANPITSPPNDIEGIPIPHHIYPSTEIRFVNSIVGPATIEFQCETRIPSGYSLMLGPEWHNHTVVDKDGFRVENYNGDPTFNVEMDNTGTSIVTIGKKNAGHFTQTSNVASFTDSTGKESVVYISSQEIIPGCQLAELGFHDGRATVSATKLNGGNTELLLASGQEVTSLDDYDMASISLVDSELISGTPGDIESAVYSDPYVNIHGQLQLDSTLKPQYGGTGQTSLQATRNAMGLGNTLSALPIANGGTGLSSSPSMLTNLGSTTAANVLAASPRPGITGTLGAANGGTGQTSLQATRNAMGLGNTTGALPIANGGTGQTTAADARTALGAAHNVWTSLTSSTNDTAMTYDLTDYKEVLFAARAGTTYVGSVIVPKGQLSTTARQFYLSGGQNSSSGGRGFALTATDTTATPAARRVDGTQTACNWWTYAR